MAKEISDNNYQYFRVDSDGYIYLRSKEQLEGYKPYYDKDDKLLGYKKIFSATDTGLIKYVGVRVADFPTGKVDLVNIAIQGADGIENVQFQLFDSKGRLSGHAISLAMILPNVDFSKEYSLSFGKKKDANGYLEKKVFLNDKEGNSVAWFHKFKNKEDNNGGDIPNLDVKEGVKGITYDSTARDKFLYDSLLNQCNRFQEFISGKVTNDIGKEEVKEVKKPTVPIVDEDDDDIPF